MARTAAVLIGILSLAGAVPAAADEPAQLSLRTPDLAATFRILAGDGQQVASGQTGLLGGPLELSPGSYEVCVAHEARGRLCTTLTLEAGVVTEWIVWPGELRCAVEDERGGACVYAGRVAVPAGVVRVRVVVDGEPAGWRRPRPAAPGDDTIVEIPPFRDVWLEMIDGEGRACLCHPGQRETASAFRCGWTCR